MVTFVFYYISEDVVNNSGAFLSNNFLSSFPLYVQLFFVLLVLWVLLKKSDKHVGFSKEDELTIKNWNPKALINFPAKDGTKNFVYPYVVDKKIGKHIYVNGIKCLNLTSYNFLGLSANSKCEEKIIKAVKRYGIGSCGPRGFYGTVDVHLQLEEELANFFGVEEVIVYSYGFSTISSAIPAYAKRSDIIFADENVKFAIQKGMDASRSEIIYFRHNDVIHLETLLTEQSLKHAKNKKKFQKVRKFLVVEGIYHKSGDICPLPELIRLKKKFNLRLFIDESLSFGTLGKTGRGITEHFQLSIQDVDLIMGSMEHSLASVGGFCAGTSFIVEHQRLSGLGYCFSASLPPPLTVAAITNLKQLKEEPSLLVKLKNNCQIVHNYLINSEKIAKEFVISGDEISPIKHLISRSECLIADFVSYCHKQGVAVCKAAYLSEDRQPCNPSIQLSISNLLSLDDVKHVIDTFENALDNINCTR